MRPILVAAFALALGISGAALGQPSTAWAQSLEIGPGGVRVSPHSDRYERRRDRRWDRRRERCRTIIERHRNRFGEIVETRRRVCR